MSTISPFLPHKVMYHIALAKCYRYVMHNFMWKKKRVRRHSPYSMKGLIVCVSELQEENKQRSSDGVVLLVHDRVW